MAKLMAFTKLMGCLAASVLARSAYAQVGDVFDQFYRYTDSEHKVYFTEHPGETVDPFSGTLRIVQTDLVLPGKAGLDLRIVRSYSSKIWGRSDLLQAEPLLAEKEHSVLGYGWIFHMGRLKDPNALGSSGSCSGSFPIFESPDGTTRIFYPTATSGRWISKDYWLLQTNCSAVLGAAGACIWSNFGTRYEFLAANQYYYGAGTTPVWPTSAIVDTLHPNNRISVGYLGQGAVNTITDTYNRVVTFSYTAIDNVTNRLDSMTANGHSYLYQYTFYQSGCGAGCYPVPGSGRYFLTSVLPPVGPGYQYQYATDVPVAQNQYALKQITYPAGGTTSYVYGSTPFYTGYENVSFAVVTRRVVAGRNVQSGTWQYSYSIPGTGSALNVTTITRPDGKRDAYSMYGLGYVAGRNPTNPTGNSWLIGLTKEVARADRAEVETLTWEKLPAAVSSAFFNAPVYSSCGVYPIYDSGIFVPVMTQRSLARDGATFTTAYSTFDGYGQAKTVSESGSQSVGTRTRTTTWTFDYVSDQAINWVRGRPATQHVVAEGDAVDNGWTYFGAPDYARRTETLAGVTTTFAYDTDGNLSRVTNALGQYLGLSGYVTGKGTPTTLDFNGAFTFSRTTTWEGWIQTQKNGRDQTTGYDWDAIGRIKKVTPPGTSNYTTYTYATDGSSVLMTRGSYSKTTSLDGLGRITGSSDSESVLTSTRYDGMGRATFRSYPYDVSGGEVGDLFDLDGLDRVMTRTKAYRPASLSCDVAGSCTETMTYSSNCVITVVNRKTGDAATTKVCNGSYGDPGERSVQQVTDANSKVWQYAYTGHGDLKTVTAPLSAGSRTYAYFPATYFPKSDASGESGTTTYSRNAIGQMKTRLDARAILATYDYTDPLSRLKSITYGAGSAADVTRGYDNESNLTALSSASGGSFTNGYDEVNRQTAQSWVFGGHTYSTTFHFDPAGCLDSVTYPTGTSLTMTCDSANRTKTVKLGTAVLVSNVTYHPSGQPKEITYGGSTPKTVLVYDDRARAKTITSTGVVGLAYGYDGADNVTSFGNGAVPISNRTMSYDKLDRILTSVAPSLWGSIAYDYDALGNRTLKSETLTTNFTYDTTSNRLASASSKEVYAPLTLTWDVAGRLASTSDGGAYLYDGRGRRVQKADAGGTTLYHYDSNGRIIAETLPDGTKLRDYVYLGNKLLVVDGCITTAPPGCSEREWYHTDTLGTPVARTNTSGVVTARFDTKAWGETAAGTSGSSGDRQYNGRVFDSQTGFYDYGARMYWPQVARFISADSHMGLPSSPMTLNRYAYVVDGPFRFVDPSGTWLVPVHWAMSADAMANRAFSAGDKFAMYRAQWNADMGPGAQSNQAAHAMRQVDPVTGETGTAVGARGMAVFLAASNLEAAIGLWKAGDHDGATEALWRGAHTVQDQFSPAHEGYQVWNESDTLGKALHILKDWWGGAVDRKAYSGAVDATGKYLDLFLKGVSPNEKADPATRYDDVQKLFPYVAQ